MNNTYWAQKYSASIKQSNSRMNWETDFTASTEHLNMIYYKSSFFIGHFCKNSKIFYSTMERNGMALFRLGTWKTRDWGRGGKRTSPLCREKDDSLLLPKWTETRRWGRNFWTVSGLNINKMVYEKSINCTKTSEFRSLGRYLCNIKWQYENYMKKIIPTEQEEHREYYNRNLCTNTTLLMI